MKWTDNIPCPIYTSWYWWRMGPQDRSPEMAQVTIGDFGKPQARSHIDGDFEDCASDAWKGQWSDEPITEPSEP